MCKCICIKRVFSKMLYIMYISKRTYPYIPQLYHQKGLGSPQSLCWYPQQMITSMSPSRTQISVSNSIFHYKELTLLGEVTNFSAGVRGSTRRTQKISLYQKIRNCSNNNWGVEEDTEASVNRSAGQNWGKSSNKIKSDSNGL